jgi:hypothetical protein
MDARRIHRTPQPRRHKGTRKPSHHCWDESQRAQRSSNMRVGEAWLEGRQTSWWRVSDREESEGQAGCPPPQRTADHCGGGVSPLTPGLLGRPRRPSVARAAWSKEGGRKDCDHAARASGGLLLSRDTTHSALFPWIARHGHCAGRRWLLRGCRCTMPSPARPGERCFHVSGYGLRRCDPHLSSSHFVPDNMRVDVSHRLSTGG